MAPSKKLRTLRTETTLDDHLSKSALVSNPPDTTTFLSLPVEIFDMILSYFEDIDEDMILLNSIALPLACRERADVLRALSQTCKGLRGTCLSLAWERLEACTADMGGAWYQQLSVRLENVGKLVGMRPYLAKHVRTVTVSLTKCSADTVLSPFVRCLESLPNLETLQIVYASLQMTTTLNDAFKGHTFPRIRNITLPSCAHNILRCCPEVRRVVCSQNDGGKLLTAIQRGCKKVEVARGFKADPALMKRLIKAVPSLREVGLDARLDYLVTINGTGEPSIAALQHLSNAKQLRTVRLTIGDAFEYSRERNYSLFDTQISVAKEALEKIKTQDEKKLVVMMQVFALGTNGGCSWVTADTKEMIL